MILQRKELPPLVRGALNRRRRTVILSINRGGQESVQLTGTTWDGGSISRYALLNLTTGEVQALSAPADFGGGPTPTVGIPLGWCVVETGVFCGKPATPSITLRNDDLAAWLGLTSCLAGMPGLILYDWLVDQDRLADARAVRELLEGAGLWTSRSDVR